MFYFKNKDSLTVIFTNGNSVSFNKDDKNYEKALKLCEKNDWIGIDVLNNTTKYIMTQNVTVNEDGSLTVVTSTNQNFAIENEEDNKLLQFIQLLKKKGVIDSEIEAIKPFLKNMFENTYIDAVTELYDFCSKLDFAITEDGCFVAYKKVRPDLGSFYDNGQTKHHIGEYTITDTIDTDRNNTCSYGLHFCSHEYLEHYGSVCEKDFNILLVKINPKDVISIPIDYNYEKGRCCKYLPIAVIPYNKLIEDINIEELTGIKIVNQHKTFKKLDNTNTDNTTSDTAVNTSNKQVTTKPADKPIMASDPSDKPKVTMVDIMKYGKKVVKGKRGFNEILKKYNLKPSFLLECIKQYKIWRENHD